MSTVSKSSSDNRAFIREDIEVLPPYSELYYRGISYTPKDISTKKRAFVSLRKRGDGGDVIVPYYRYLFQAQYWKDHGEWIPEGMEVDHINNNPYDDRLENLQLLTTLENIQKRDEYHYGRKPVNDRMLSQIEEMLTKGDTRSDIVKQFKITYGHLRYLIHRFLPTFENTTYLERNTDDIVQLMSTGVTAADVGERYGVSRTTVLRIYEKSTGCKYTESNTKERVAFISEKIDAGHTLGQITGMLGVTEGAVLYLVKKYLPEKWKIMQKNYTDKAHYGSEYKLEKLAKIETYLDSGHSLTSASNLVGIKQQQASAWIAELRPDLKQKMRQTRSYRLTDEQKKNMVEDYVAGSTFSLLAVKYQVSTATVHKFCTEAGVVRAPRAV